MAIGIHRRLRSRIISKNQLVDEGLFDVVLIKSTQLNAHHLSIFHDQPLLAVVMCSMAGACFGFLRFNFSPAKIFLGDSGSLFLGIKLAVSATFGSVKEQLGA